MAGRLNCTNQYASPLISETKTETYQMLSWAVLFFVTLKVLTQNIVGWAMVKDG